MLSPRWSIPAVAIQRPAALSLPYAVAWLLMLMLMLGQTLVDQYSVFGDINRVVGIALVLLYTLGYFVREPRLAPELVLFGLFVLWSIPSSLTVAADPNLAVMWLRLIIQVWALAFTVAGLAMAKRSTMGPIVIIIICAAFLEAYCALTGNASLRAGVVTRTRVSSLLENPNAFGILMLYAIGGLAFLWGTKKAFVFRLGLPIVAVWFTFALVASGSRKSFACLLAFIFFWLWFCYRRHLFRRVRTVLLVITTLVGVYLLINYTFSATLLGERFRESLESQGKGAGLGEYRTLAYVRGLELLSKHPVFGIGLGNFNVVAEIGGSPHSDYIDVLTTTGVVGALLYFSLYVVLWRRLSRIRKLTSDPEVQYHAGVFKAMVVAMLLLGLGAPRFSSTYHWFLLAGIIGWSFAIDPARSLRERFVRVARLARLRR